MSCYRLWVPVIRSPRRQAQALVRGAEGVATLVALVVLATTGCRREGIQVYDAPKQEVTTTTPPADPHAGLNMSSGMAAAAVPSVSPLRWELPAGWKELPASQMRVGNFAVSGANDQKAEITIIPLSGRAGSELENVNRWLGQLGSPQLTSEELAKLAEKVSVGGAEAPLYDLAAPEGQAARKRTIAAILRREGTAWFFKMTGDDALVAAQKPAFVELLKSIRFEAPSAASTAGSPTPGESLPAAARTASPATAAGTTPSSTPSTAGSGKPAFTVPPTWKEQPAGQMQLAKFVPEAAAGKAEVTVAVLPGDGGGTAANVNRWRRQLGLPPWTEAEVKSAAQALKVEGADAYLVDLANTENQKRMLAAGVIRGGQSWFYKLMGESPAVEAEKAAFVRFVESVKYAP